MDVLHRFLPRSAGGGVVQFRRLRQNSHQSVNSPAEQLIGKEKDDNHQQNNGEIQQQLTDTTICDYQDRSLDKLALLHATNSSRVELGLVLKNHQEKQKKTGTQKNGGISTMDSDKMGNPNLVRVESRSGVQTSNGSSDRTIWGGGKKRMIGALLPGRRKEPSLGKLSTSASEPHLHIDDNYGCPESLNGESVTENGGANGMKHRLYEGSRRRRFHVTEALQRVVRGRLQTRNSVDGSSSNNPLPLPIPTGSASSSSISRPSNMLSSNSPSDPNSPTKSNGDANRQAGKSQQDGVVLAKFRKQTKIMDIMSRKSSHGANGKQKSDVQRLLLAEDGYSSGME